MKTSAQTTADSACADCQPHLYCSLRGQVALLT